MEKPEQESLQTPGWKGKGPCKMAGGGLRAGRPQKAWKMGVHGLSFVFELLALDQCLLQPSPPTTSTCPEGMGLLNSDLSPSLGASPVGRVSDPSSSG